MRALRHLWLAVILAGCSSTTEPSDLSEDDAGSQPAGAGGTATTPPGDGGRAGGGRTSAGGAPGAGGASGTGGARATGGASGTGGTPGPPDAGSGGAGAGGGGTERPPICPDAAAPVRGVPIIVDTDMGPDCDDVAALAVVHALAGRGEATLLAVTIMTSAGDYNPGICVADEIDTYYGRPDVPVGVWKGGAFKFVDTYTVPMSTDARFAHSLGPSNDGVPEAKTLLRSTLACQPDRSVTVVEIGMLNNLKALLDSGPDEYSALGGRDLVAQKVLRLVEMAGEYPSGSEFNFYTQVQPGDSKAVVEGWPTPIVFIGGELGWRVLTGGSFDQTLAADNPVRRAYDLYAGPGAQHPSWDPLAALFAVREAAAGFTLVGGGTNQLEPSGANTWHDTPDAQRYYLTLATTPDAVAATLTGLIATPPAR